jgi:dihydroorotase
MQKILIKNAKIVNENRQFLGSVLINGEQIEKIAEGKDSINIQTDWQVVDADGLVLIPGVIDDQVHFREPGLTYKAEIYTEAKAAVAGGVTSYMEMPNTFPLTVTQDLLEQKYQLAAEKSLANYSFYFGATNTNIDELLKTDAAKVCGIKVFMGSSTGNMLVDDETVLHAIFANCKLPIAVHCEDEATIRKNFEEFKAKYGEDVKPEHHPLIRSTEACYKSSSLAVRLAKEHNARLHLLHLSTAKELELLDNKLPAKEKRITGEVCVHHLWFDDSAYQTLGNRVKWNPAIKTAKDREALFEAVLNGTIDVIATDHAPHTMDEKNKAYLKAPSGGPFVQHSLVTMLEFYHQGEITLEKVVEKMCHTPADIFQVKERGYLREGYKADLVLFSLNSPWTVSSENILYKCQWSPVEGLVFQSKVLHTFVNGHHAFANGCFDERIKGQRLEFER